MEDFTENDAEVLSCRCQKLSALDLRSTLITNNGFKFIIQNLLSTLEEIDITDTNITIDTFSDELKNMPKLKIFNVGG